MGASKGIITFGKDAEDVFLLKENHEFRPELRMHVGQGAEIGRTPRFRLLSRENGNLRQSWPALRGQGLLNAIEQPVDISEARLYTDELV